MTGLGEDTSVLHARSIDECHIYMQLHPCTCGEPLFVWSRHGQAGHPEGVLSVYEGSCGRCGASRRFEFVLPADPAPPPAIGGPEPSAIIDPAQFLLAARQAVSAVRAGAAPTPRDAADAVGFAIAALEEALKFVPRDGDRIPVEAFFSVEGRQEHELDPDQFRRDRLVGEVTAYRALLTGA
ncbi:hypothetical protein [Dactylosporangium sp. CA-092794]|uniref:hypothetical protein n=1 Tax=Dactylosporangium sp. CA-092794 TaxID=3239929 RepID=UPI003D8BC34D